MKGRCDPDAEPRARISLQVFGAALPRAVGSADRSARRSVWPDQYTGA